MRIEYQILKKGGGGTFKHIHVHLVITDTLNSQMSKSKKRNKCTNSNFKP